jgi:hypothetical protein
MIIIAGPLFGVKTFSRTLGGAARSARIHLLFDAASSLLSPTFSFLFLHFLFWRGKFCLNEIL